MSPMCDGRLNPSSSTLWIKLEEERVRMIELEEQLSRWKDKAEQLKVELSLSRSTVASQEEEVRSLRQEVGSLKNSQSAVLCSQPPLIDSNMEGVIDKKRGAERGVARGAPGMTELAGPSTGAMVPSLYDCLQGKMALTICLQQPSTLLNLGLEFDGLSSFGDSCTAIKAVQEGSPAQGILLPGDVILEVNGMLCSGNLQSKAVGVLSKAAGSIQLVVAREKGAMFNSPLYQSTPVRYADDVDVPLTKGKCADDPRREPAVENLGSKLCEAQERCGLLQEELQAVNTQLVNSTMDYELVTSEHCELLNEVSYHTEEMEEVKSLVSEIKVALIGMQEVVGQEEGRVEYLVQQNVLLSSKLQALEDSRHGLEVHRKALESQAVIFTRKVEELRAELTMVKAENDQLLSDLARKDRDHSELRRRVEAAEKERELKLASQLGENEKRTLKIRQQEDAASEMKATNQELQREKEELAVRLRAQQASLSSTEDSVRLLTKDKSALQEEVQFLEKELNSCKEQLQSELIGSKNVTMELKALHNKEASLARTASRLQEEAKRLREMRDSLLAENVRLKEACNIAETQARSNSVSVRQLQSQLEGVVQEKDALLTQLRDVARESEGHLQELEGAKSHLLNLQNASTSPADENKSKGEFYQMANDSPPPPSTTSPIPDASKGREGDQGTAMASLQLCPGSTKVGPGHHKEVAVLHSQLRELHRTVVLQREANEAEVLAVCGELEEAQTEAQSLRVELEEAQADVQDVTSKLEEARVEAQRLRADFRDLMESQRVVLGDKEAELHHAEAARALLESQVSEMRVRVERQCEEMKECVASLADQREQYSCALHDLEVERDRSAKMADDLKQLQSEHDGLVVYKRLYEQSQFNQKLLQKDLVEGEAKLQALQDKLVAVESELHSENHTLRAQSMAKDEKIVLLNQRLQETESLKEADSAQIKDEVRLLQQEVKSLQDSHKAWEDAASLNQANLRQLEAVLTVAKEARESALRDLEEARLTNKQLQEAVAKHQKELSEVQSAYDELSIVAEEHRSSAREVADLTAKLRDTEVALAASREHEQLKAVNALTTEGLQIEVSPGHPTAEGTVQAPATQDEGTTQDGTQAVSTSHQLVVGSVRQDKEGILRDLEGARQKCKELEEEMTSLKKVTLQSDKVERGSTSRSRRYSMGQTADYQAKLEVSQANLDVSRRLLEANEKKLKHSLREVEDLAAEKAALEMNLGVARRTLDEKEKGMEELEKELCRLATAVAECEDRLKESQQRLAKEEQAHKETQKVLQEVMEAQRALRTSISAQEVQRETDILNLKTRIVELEKGSGQGLPNTAPVGEVEGEQSLVRDGEEGNEGPCEAYQSGDQEVATSDQDQSDGVDKPKRTRIVAIAS